MRIPLATKSSSPSQHLRKTVSQLESQTMGLQSLPQKEKSSSGTPPVTAVAQATLLASSINLLKNCVGAGVFSLNARVNAVSTNPQQFPVIVLMIFGMAFWAIHNFYILGETCRITKSKTFGEAWSKAVSASTQWLVQFVVTVSPMISCLANIIVLTDVLTLLLRVLGAPFYLYENRVAVIGLLCAVVLYPICIVKDLSGLKSVSLIGLCGQAIATLSLGLRLSDKSYQVGGKYLATANIGQVAKDYLSSGGGGSSSSSRALLTTPSVDISKWFVLASLLSYCFVTHYNAPRYYTELKDKDTHPHRFLTMASLSYLAAAGIYIITILLSNRLFSPFSSQSFALNSFSPQDPVAVFAFSAFGTSVLASFPLIFFTMRNWFISQAERYQVKGLNNIPVMTSLLLAVIGSAAVYCKDIGKVGAIAGAIFGSSMMFIFPSIMYINVLSKQAQGVVFREAGAAAVSSEESEVVTGAGKIPVLKLVWNYLLLVGGLGIGLMGTINSVKALFH